jgi:hypothetical protein
MKASINKNGKLMLLADNDLESYALSKWLESEPIIGACVCPTDSRVYDGDVVYLKAIEIAKDDPCVPDKPTPPPTPPPSCKKTQPSPFLYDLDDPILMHALNKSFGIKPGYGLTEVAPGVSTIRFPTYSGGCEFGCYDIPLEPIQNSDIRVGYDELQNMVYISRGNKK